MLWGKPVLQVLEFWIEYKEIIKNALKHTKILRN